jgi:hypothetical protein
MEKMPYSLPQIYSPSYRLFLLRIFIVFEQIKKRIQVKREAAKQTSL